jgi:hypothetical protein
VQGNEAVPAPMTRVASVVRPMRTRIVESRRLVFRSTSKSTRSRDLEPKPASGVPPFLSAEQAPEHRN